MRVDLNWRIVSIVLILSGTMLAAHAAEVWNPSTGQWTTLASNVVSRGYHATSILLPDGRVLHSGSGDASNQVDAERGDLFTTLSVPRPAPRDTAAPAELHYGT